MNGTFYPGNCSGEFVPLWGPFCRGAQCSLQTVEPSLPTAKCALKDRLTYGDPSKGGAHTIRGGKSGSCLNPPTAMVNYSRIAPDSYQRRAKRLV